MSEFLIDVNDWIKKNGMLVPVQMMDPPYPYSTIPEYGFIPE
jgi:hypothetical protein